jgi:hypothetical protein
MEGAMKRTLAVAFCLLASLVALPAYPQQRDLQEAIKDYLSKQGPLSEIGKPTQVMADLDGDGRQEAVVTFCIDENLPGGKNARANNPDNIHCTLSVFKQSKDQWGVVAKMSLGQGKLREIRGGKIYVETLAFGARDPLCCPSQKLVSTFELRNGILVKAK